MLIKSRSEWAKKSESRPLHDRGDADSAFSASSDVVASTLGNDVWREGIGGPKESTCTPSREATLKDRWIILDLVISLTLLPTYLDTEIGLGRRQEVWAVVAVNVREDLTWDRAKERLVLNQEQAPSSLAFGSPWFRQDAAMAGNLDLSRIRPRVGD